MAQGKTPVDISITTAYGAFITSCISIVCGCILIFVSSGNQLSELTVKTKDVTINLYTFTPGVVLAAFGALLAGWTVHRLIKK